jgi:hypothetical protein
MKNDDMLDYIFIKTHKNKAIDYISKVFESEQPSSPNIMYSLRGTDETQNEEKPRVLYSSRGPRGGFDPSLTEKDRFDSYLVSSAMKCYLQDMQPTTPISSTTNLTFVEKLTLLIRQKNLVEPEIYKSAQMDRRLFSKILSNAHYSPSKDTVLALIFAMKLNLDESKDLLERAGYTLSHSLKRDIIIEYFIKEQVCDLNNINAFLYDMDEKIIGRTI